MYIKSIVLEGFKSYAQRTEISGFDPYFNAITGLNGSGKSNILDGICFLLGISNLSQVRASGLTELIYKNGREGVNKATVSITFDNKNKDHSPIGYVPFDELTISRQIAVGSRNKFMINGLASTSQKLQDLFRSVQLNVNNPHFLIMQGMVTKVLNMKPQEILSMIDEAIGTKIYENKKASTSKLLDKMDHVFSEVEKSLVDEINPSLMRLKEDKSTFLEFQKVCRELEYFTKYTVAFEFYSLQNIQKNLKEKLVAMKEEMESLQMKVEERSKVIQELSHQISSLEEKRDKEEGGKLAEVQKLLEAAEKKEQTTKCEMEAVVDEHQREKKKFQELQDTNIKEDKNLIAKKKLLEKIKDQLENLHQTAENQKAAYQQAIQHLQATKVGLASGQDGEKDASIQEQLRVAKMEITNSEIIIKDNFAKLKHKKEDLKKQQLNMKSFESSYKKEQADLQVVKETVAKLEANLEELKYEEGLEEKLGEEHFQLERIVTSLRDQLHSLQTKYQMEFEYTDPENNFDRTSVKGLVAKLFKVKQPQHAVALETVAGGKLYQVVVNNEQTCKKLLERGNLRKRVTFIPLNKIAGRSIPGDVVRKAEELVGKENVSTALSLVAYDHQLEPAMTYVFGSSFICHNMDVAKQVAFHPSIKRKTVTLSGNSFDPAGLASGGSRPTTESVLLTMTKIKENEEKLEKEEEKLKKLNLDLKKVQVLAAKWRELNDRLDMKKNELDLLVEKLKNSRHGRQFEEVEELKNSIANMEKEIKKAEEMKIKMEKRVVELEEGLKNKDKLMEREVEKAEKKLTEAKKKMEKMNSDAKIKEKEFSMLKMELEDLEKEHVDTNEEMRGLQESIKEKEGQVVALEIELNKDKTSVTQYKEKVKKQKDLLREFNRDVEEKQEKKEEEVRQKKEELEKKDDLKKNIDDEKKKDSDIKNRLKQLLSDHLWINEEISKFGVSNSNYDFSSTKPNEMEGKMKKLEDVKGKLFKKINPRAMTILTNAEEHHTKLVERIPKVEKDRVFLKDLFVCLDFKKQETLKQAVEKINEDFGSIFSSMLPGASAKLVPLEETGVLVGVEFKVGFGGVWKESLTELSGGQRSLVALSLILALLLHNPAPLYILDEVDSALDLSHTQNIGSMLKTHFKHSQFIIVSLKDGMYNNANVLFRTSFVDGVSTITRHTNIDQGNKEKDKKGVKRRI